MILGWVSFLLYDPNYVQEIFLFTRNRGYVSTHVATYVATAAIYTEFGSSLLTESN